MAYYRRGYASNRGYSRRVRRYSTRLVRGKRSVFGKKKTGGSSTRISTRKIATQMQSIKLEQRHGKARSLAFKGSPQILGFQEGRVGEYYFFAPVSDILLGSICRPGKVGEVYVTGVALEMDIQHCRAADFFAMCVPVSAGDRIAPIAVDGLNFALGAPRSEEKQGKGASPLLDGRDLMVQTVGRSALTGVARDETLFGAPLRPGVLPKGDYSVNGKTKSAHRGRAEAGLSRHQAAVTGVQDAYVRDCVRVYWRFDKTIQVCDSGFNFLGDKYVILVGLRPQSDLGGLLPTKGATPAPLMVQNVQVTVNFRA